MACILNSISPKSEYYRLYLNSIFVSLNIWKSLHLVNIHLTTLLQNQIPPTLNGKKKLFCHSTSTFIKARSNDIDDNFCRVIILRNLFLFQILFNFFFYFSLNKFTDFLHDETKIYWQKLKKIKTERQKGDTMQNKIDRIFFNFFTSRVFSRKREVDKNGSSYVVIFLLLFRTNISHL